MAPCYGLDIERMDTDEVWIRIVDGADDRLVLHDALSAGGTFINSAERVLHQRPRALVPGDVVHLGPPPVGGRLRSQSLTVR